MGDWRGGGHQQCRPAQPTAAVDGECWPDHLPTHAPPCGAPPRTYTVPPCMGECRMPATGTVVHARRSQACLAAAAPPTAPQGLRVHTHMCVHGPRAATVHACTVTTHACVPACRTTLRRTARSWSCTARRRRRPACSIFGLTTPEHATPCHAMHEQQRALAGACRPMWALPHPTPPRPAVSTCGAARRSLPYIPYTCSPSTLPLVHADADAVVVVVVQRARRVVSVSSRRV